MLVLILSAAPKKMTNLCLLRVSVGQNLFQTVQSFVGLLGLSPRLLELLGQVSFDSPGFLEHAPKLRKLLRMTGPLGGRALCHLRGTGFAIGGKALKIL